MTLLNQTTNRVSIYLKIITKYNSRYYFQNHSSDTINWRSYDWDYLPIEMTAPPKSIDLDNVSITATLPNVPLIIQALRNNDGFRESVVFMYFNFPEAGNTTFTEDLLSVRSTKITNVVEFTLQSPFSAVGAGFPSVYYITGKAAKALDLIGYLPEVPLVAKTNLQ